MGERKQGKKKKKIRRMCVAACKKVNRSSDNNAGWEGTCSRRTHTGLRKVPGRLRGKEGRSRSPSHGFQMHSQKQACSPCVQGEEIGMLDQRERRTLLHTMTNKVLELLYSRHCAGYDVTSVGESIRSNVHGIDSKERLPCSRCLCLQRNLRLQFSL